MGLTAQRQSRHWFEVRELVMHARWMMVDDHGRGRRESRFEAWLDRPGQAPEADSRDTYLGLIERQHVHNRE